MPVARETLYQEIWAEPMTTVAKRYEVSSNFLARVCEQLNVPHPPRGYWQQLKVGKTVEKPVLLPDVNYELPSCCLTDGCYQRSSSKSHQTFTSRSPAPRPRRRR